MYHIYRMMDDDNQIITLTRKKLKVLIEEAVIDALQKLERMGA